MKTTPYLLDDLPGAELMQKGVEDVQAGTESAESCLLALAAPALRELGVALPTLPSPGGDAEELLRCQLQDEGREEAFLTYHLLLQSIVKFAKTSKVPEGSTVHLLA